MARNEKKAHLRCEHCAKEFISPIQFPEGSSVTMTGNRTKCPGCGKMTGADKPFWK